MARSSLGTALVTGASFGIGAVYADQLAKRGYDLILVARNGERLKSLAERLTSETGRSVTPLIADLGDKAGISRFGSMAVPLDDAQPIVQPCDDRGAVADAATELHHHAARPN